MRIVSVLSVIFLLSVFASAQKKDAADALLGDWTGDSKCVGSNPYCHDEVVIYHLTRSKTDASKINLSADKIVNKKPEFMGEFDLTFDPEKMTLTGDFTIKRTGGKGVWLFRIDGDRMSGTLTVFPENEIGRKVSVTRSKTGKH